LKIKTIDTILSPENLFFFQKKGDSMKKHILALLAAMSVLTNGLQAEICDGNFYVGGFAGANFMEQDSKVGFAGGLSLGYEFENHIRLEAEFAYRRNKVHVGSLDNDDGINISWHGKGITWNTYSAMANVLYDIDLGCNWTPYLGFGLGYAWNKVNIDCSKANKHFIDPGTEIHNYDKGAFAFQGIAGVAYNFTEKTSVGLEYRYFQSQSMIKDHSVAISLRQKF